MIKLVGSSETYFCSNFLSSCMVCKFLEILLLSYFQLINIEIFRFQVSTLLENRWDLITVETTYLMKRENL